MKIIYCCNNRLGSKEVCIQKWIVGRSVAAAAAASVWQLRILLTCINRLLKWFFLLFTINFHVTNLRVTRYSRKVSGCPIIIFLYSNEHYNNCCVKKYLYLRKWFFMQVFIYVLYNNTSF